MKDYTFQVEKVLHASRFVAARRAVFSYLLGKEWSQERNAITTALGKIRAMWHARLFELKKLNWPPVAADKSFQYMRNCPPFGVLTSQPARTCKRHDICPFCYARHYVIEPFNHLEKYLFGGKRYTDEKGEFKRAPEGVRLVEFQKRRSIHIRYAPKKKWSFNSIIKLTPLALDVLRPVRAREVRLLSSLSGVVLHKLEPHPGYMVLKRTGLILTRDEVPADFVPRLQQYERFKHRVSPEGELLTKRMLSAAAGRVFSYPVRMMLAPADEVIALLAQLHEFRRMSKYRDSNA